MNAIISAIEKLPYADRSIAAVEYVNPNLAGAKKASAAICFYYATEGTMHRNVIEEIINKCIESDQAESH